MKIRRLEITNFRAITRMILRDLGGAVVVAGPNGCGKSCILDAIRFLKSSYGEYQHNELHLWMSEFNVQLTENQQSILGIFQDRRKELVIRIGFQLSSPEKEWLQRYSEQLVRQEAWRTVAPEVAGWSNPLAAAVSPLFRERRQRVEELVRDNMKVLLAEINQDEYLGEIHLTPSGELYATESRILRVVLGTYRPKELGVIDYHGPHRSFNREQLGGINLNAFSIDEQLRQHALYNYANKYANIKSELAASYIRERIMSEAGAPEPKGPNLSETLKNLFATFFPGKEFLGPQPTRSGTLEFSVKTSYGAVHDINDLSSGEKEVLYGYLRLRNTAPLNSIILLDEPELHLNPRLTEGLPQFYYNHLGKALGNQIWLVTHSDAILRQAVSHPEFQVFHMHPPSSTVENQATEVQAAEEVERVVIDLVGDLAAYRPNAKVVIVEGGGDSEFDARSINMLFPDFQLRVNLISGGNKYRVRDLHGLLEEARAKGSIPGRFYSITDRDFDEDQSRLPGQVFTWDRYHIENYLLEDVYIYEVLRDLNLVNNEIRRVEDVDLALRESARRTMGALVSTLLQELANRELVSCIQTKIDPHDQNVPVALTRVIQASIGRLENVTGTHLTIERLMDEEASYRARFERDLVSGEWRKNFRGRDILKRFVGNYLRGAVTYTALRDLILARMRDARFQPPGMKQVIDAILADA